MNLFSYSQKRCHRDCFIPTYLSVINDNYWESTEIQQNLHKQTRLLQWYSIRLWVYIRLCPQILIFNLFFSFSAQQIGVKRKKKTFLFIYQLVREHFTVEEIPEEQQDPVYHSPDIHLLKLKRIMEKAVTNQIKSAVPSTNQEQKQNQAWMRHLTGACFPRLARDVCDCRVLQVLIGSLCWLRLLWLAISSQALRNNYK